MHDLRKTNLKEWYHLAVADDGRSLILRVSPAAFASLVTHCANHRIIHNAQVELGLADFLPVIHKGAWGLAGCITSNVSSGGIECHCSLPTHRKDSNQDAVRQTLYNLACTLASIFNVLVYQVSPETDPTAYQQLMLVDSLLVREDQAGLSVIISPILSSWIKERYLCRTSELTVVTWMITAYNWMVRPLLEPSGLSFQAVVDPPIDLIFECPGNRAGLVMDHEDQKQRDAAQPLGYRLSSSNVDTVVQALTLLVGIAGMFTVIGNLPPTLD